MLAQQSRPRDAHFPLARGLLSLTDMADYDALRLQVRKLVDEVVRPNAERIDRESIFPRENLQALARAGWNGVLLPKELGGLGLDHVAFAIAAEEIGSACASTALVYVMHIGAAQTIEIGRASCRERVFALV